MQRLLQLAVLGAALVAAHAHAEPAGPLAEPAGGWRAARWDMSVEEVLGALPGEAVPVEPRLKLPDGSSVAVAIPSHVVGGRRFMVHFVFRGGKLALVSLRTAPGEDAGADAFDGLEKHLEARLGPPAERSRDAGLVDMRQDRWDVGRTRVDLKYIPGTIVILHSPLAGGKGESAAKPATR